MSSTEETLNGVEVKTEPVTGDGIDHINVWSKGRTELGRQLSNFAHTPFKHPVHGSFASMEAFWYWLGSGKKHDELRRLHGISAKNVGVKLLMAAIPEDEFQKGICEGIRCKLAQNAGLRLQFAESTLPFRHYFVYGQKGEVIVEKAKHKWQMDFLEKLRDEYKAHFKKTLSNESTP